jgi:hypothetical protein
MSKRKPSDKMTQVEFEAWMEKHGGLDWLKDQPIPTEYSSSKEYEKALRKWQGRLSKVNLKTTELNENGEETNRRHYDYRPTHIDVWDDSFIRYISLKDEAKALKSRLKKPHLDKDSKVWDRKDAQTAAKKLRAKHPDWELKKIMEHRTVAPFLSHINSYQQKWRILTELIPAKGKPSKNRTK